MVQVTNMVQNHKVRLVLSCPSVNECRDLLVHETGRYSDMYCSLRENNLQKQIIALDGHDSFVHILVESAEL